LGAFPAADPRLAANGRTTASSDWGLPVRTHHFQRDAQGSPGHLRIAEEEEMGEELANKILSLDVRWTD
jgi:hypothetical protein